MTLSEETVCLPSEATSDSFVQLELELEPCG